MNDEELCSENCCTRLARMIEMRCFNRRKWPPLVWSVVTLSRTGANRPNKFDLLLFLTVRAPAVRLLD